MICVPMHNRRKAASLDAASVPGGPRRRATRGVGVSRPDHGPTRPWHQLRARLGGGVAGIGDTIGRASGSACRPKARSLARPATPSKQDLSPSASRAPRGGAYMSATARRSARRAASAAVYGRTHGGVGPGQHLAHHRLSYAWLVTSGQRAALPFRHNLVMCAITDSPDGAACQNRTARAPSIVVLRPSATAPRHLGQTGTGGLIDKGRGGRSRSGMGRYAHDCDSGH